MYVELMRRYVGRIKATKTYLSCLWRALYDIHREDPITRHISFSFFIHSDTPPYFCSLMLVVAVQCFAYLLIHPRFFWWFVLWYIIHMNQYLSCCLRTIILVSNSKAYENNINIKCRRWKSSFLTLLIYWC